MDAQEAKKTVARLREIYRRGKRFEVTVGDHKLTITATHWVKLAFASEADVVVKKLTDGGKTNDADSLE